MNLEDFIRSEDFQTVASADQVGASRALLAFAEKFRDKMRERNENRPSIDDVNIKKDFRFIAGQINALNLMLDLPNVARDAIKNLPE